MVNRATTQPATPATRHLSFVSHPRMLWQEIVTVRRIKVNLRRRVDGIANREDFITFVRELLRVLESDPESWESRDLDSFLEALAAWTEDMDGYYRNVGRQIPKQPTWQTFGEILAAAKMYE
jgi:hypothetical protein